MTTTGGELKKPPLLGKSVLASSISTSGHIRWKFSTLISGRHVKVPVLGTQKPGTRVL